MPSVIEGSGRSYRVLERLGQGAFGAVYLAETEGTGLSRRVAIKVPHADRASAGLIARLRDEARLLSLIRHRAIVRVDDLVELDGAWSMVMEYVEGCDLAELIADGPIPPRPALAIAEEVAQALHAAYHQSAPDGTPLRLLHRDIKPSNLRLTSAGEVKILDFGVARADFGDREAAATQSVFGTTTYLAPERYHGEDSRAGDVYALGVTLFEMLTGVPPGKSAMDADRQPPGRKWADQWAWLAQVSPELQALVASMLAMDPQARPSARDCARRLGEIRHGLAGVTLEDWAERTLPSRARGTTEERDDRSGSLLVERSTSRSVARKPAVPAWMIAVGVGAGLVALLGAVATGAVLAGLVGDEPEVAAAPLVEPVVRVAEPPAGAAFAAEPAAAEPAAAGEGTPPAEPAPVEPAPAAPTGATSAPDVAPAAGSATATTTTSAASRPSSAKASTGTSSAGASGSSASTAAATTTAPPTSASTASTTTSAASTASSTRAAAPPSGQARLVVSGEVSAVKITGPSGSVRAGNVAPGAYTVDVTFASGEHALVQDLVLAAGDSVVLRCSPVFKSCKPQAQ